MLTKANWGGRGAERTRESVFDSILLSIRSNLTIILTPLIL